MWFGDFWNKINGDSQNIISVLKLFKTVRQFGHS